MAHTFDTKLRFTGSSAPLTANYTCGAGSTVLVLSLVVAGTTPRSGGAPTFNGVAMTQAGTTRGNAAGYETGTELWYLLSPPTGSAYQVSIPNGGTAKTIYAIASSYKSATGVSALDVANGNAATTGANPSVSVTTTANGDVIVASMGNGLSSAPTGRIGTSLYETDDGSYSDSGQYLLQASAGAQAMGWTIASDDWCICVAAFKEVPLAKSGTATITGGGPISGAIRKTAVIVAAIGILGHVLAGGIKAYPVNLHGGGTVSVSAKKDASGSVLMLGGGDVAGAGIKAASDSTGISGGGNIYVWSEDHSGDLAISGNGTVAVVGTMGAIGTGISGAGIRADFESGMDDGWSSDATGSGSVTVSGGNAVVVTTVAVDEAIIVCNTALDASKIWDFESRFRVLSGIGTNTTRVLSIYQNPVVPPASIDIAAYRIEVSQNAVGGYLSVRYRTPSDGFMMWDYGSQTWKATGYTTTPGVRGDWHTAKLLSDTNGWRVEIRNQSDTLVVNTSQVAWSAVKETADPYWFIVGEFAFNTYSTSNFDYLDLGGGGGGPAPITVSGGGTVSVSSKKDASGSALMFGGGASTGTGSKGAFQQEFFTLVSDDFSSLPAGSLLSDDPDWSVVEGTPRIGRGGVYVDPYGSAKAYYVGGSVPPSNHLVRMKITEYDFNGNAGLIIRGHYTAWFRVYFGDVVFWRDGTYLGSFPATINVGDVCDVRAAGNTLTAYVNGVPLASIVDATYSTGRGGIYLSAILGNTTVGNFLIGYNRGVVVSGGGTIHASAREEAYRPGSISGGGSIVIAYHKGARVSAHVAGNGTVVPTIRMDALGQPIVAGNGSLVVASYPSHTAEYVWVLVRGGGEITVTFDAAHRNTAETSGGGNIDVQWVRSWPYIPTTPPGVDDATAIIVKIHLSYCGRTFSVDPCFASGEPCYNTWPTCKYISAYQDVGREYKFCLATIPQVVPDARPYILDIRWLPTEITTNLTVNGRIVLDMADEEDADVSIDPYWSQRATHPGTFWKKLLARNKNYKGRIVEVFEGRIVAPESNYVKRWVGRLSNVKLAQGKVTLESTDLLKDLTKIEVPPKTNAKTAAAIDAGYLQGVILTDDVDIFPSSGYVRIDDEIIRYESKDDVTKQLSTLTRAQFGTVDVAHNEKTKAQPVRYFEPKSGFDHLLDMMLVDAGMSADNVDLDAFTYWKDWPCRDIDFTAAVSEPTKLSDLFFEVVDLLDSKVWVAESLKVTIRRNIQNHPGREYYPITDDSEISDRSGAVDLNEASRVTRISYFWHKLPLGNLTEYSSYRRLDIAVDPDAETNYDGVIEKVVLSRWIDPTIGWEELIGRFVRNIGLRRVTRQRDAQPIISIEVPPKNSGLSTGDYCVLSTDEILEADGTPLSRQRYQIIRRERKGNVFALKMIRLAQRRICIIAPSGHPDYGDATEAQKEYGFVSDSGAKMSDGTEGYFIW